MQYPPSPRFATCASESFEIIQTERMFFSLADCCPPKIVNSSMLSPPTHPRYCGDTRVEHDSIVNNKLWIITHFWRTEWHKTVFLNFALRRFVKVSFPAIRRAGFFAKFEGKQREQSGAREKKLTIDIPTLLCAISTLDSGKRNFYFDVLPFDSQFHELICASSRAPEN